MEIKGECRGARFRTRLAINLTDIYFEVIAPIRCYCLAIAAGAVDGGVHLRLPRRLCIRLTVHTRCRRCGMRHAGVTEPYAIDRCRCCELAQKPAREEDRTLLISLFVNTNRGPCTLIVFGKLEGKVGDRRKRVRRDTLASTRALFLLLIPDRLMQTRRSERRSFLAIVTDNYLR